MDTLNSEVKPISRNYLAAALLFLLIFIVYSNSLEVPFHFDDTPNITKSKNIHLDKLSWENIRKTFYKRGKSEKLYRPVANFTFALNWYISKRDTTSYHVVNVFVHFFAALFLMLAVQLLFNTPNLKYKFAPKEIYFISLLGASLWALHPVQVQAVTYIVQRMASMAAMFYMASFACYIAGRLTEVRCKKTLFFLGTIICFVLAVGSKENAILLPVSLYLAEISFFRNLSTSNAKKKIIKEVVSLLVFLLVAGGLAFYLLQGNPIAYFGDLSSQYADRPFTLGERLLTEPRVIVFYIVQIFYPVLVNFSITHYFPISVSLFSPWTATPAILLILCMIGVAIYYLPKYNFLCFSILFFFLGHSVESTIFPLELAFEHRNYLPSFFIFPSIALLFFYAVNHYVYKSRIMSLLFIFIACVLLITLGISTYARNITWQSARNLWADALEKTPQVGRTHQNLAGYYIRKKKYKKAVDLLSEGKELYSSRVNGTMEGCLYNLGYVYSKMNDSEKAIKYYNKALNLSKNRIRTNVNLSLEYIRKGKFEKALNQIDFIIKKYPDKKKYLGYKGLILLKIGKSHRALKVFRRLFKHDTDNIRANIGLGVAYNKLKGVDRAKNYLEYAKKLIKSKSAYLSTYMLLIENRLLAEDIPGAKKYAAKLYKKISFQKLLKQLQKDRKQSTKWPLNTELILPFLKNYLKDRIESLEKNNMAWPVDKELLLPFLQKRLQEKGKNLLSGSG